MYILICDDEPAVARQVEQLARQHLEQRGIPVQCTVCTRGEEVLARSDLAQYQLALLDVDLETMTGIALGRRLKQQNPELVLVYISAYLEFAPEATRSVRSGISSSGIWSGCCPAVWMPCLPSTAGSADAAHPAGAARDRGTAGSDLLSGERPAQDQCLW